MKIRPLRTPHIAPPYIFSEGLAAIPGASEEVVASTIYRVPDGDKAIDLSYDLSWPLQVYGFVAARDSVDRERNYLFRCTRDSCQTLTGKVS